MGECFKTNANTMKALADPNRIKIIEILSKGERCACDILEEFKFTQPTLSYHMKILVDSGLVNSRVEGLWSHYTLNEFECCNIISFLKKLLSVKNKNIAIKKDNKCK